jgi:hypothetical protein
VHVGEIAVQQVGHQPRRPSPEDFFRDLPAGREAPARERAVAAAARHLELELRGLEREHDEAALGPAHLDCRVQHQREHVVEHAPRPQRSQALEEGRDLTEVADGRGRRPVDRRLRIGEQEDHLGAARPAEADLVAVHQDAFGDLLTVDVGAVAGIPVLQLEAVAVDRDFRMIARDFAAGQAQVVGFAAADFERALRNGNDAPSQGIGHFKTGVGHGLTV